LMRCRIFYLEKLFVHLWKRNRYWYYRKQGEKTFHSSIIPITVSDARAREKTSKMIGERRDRGETVEQLAEDFVTDQCKRLKRSERRQWAKHATPAQRAKIEYRTQ